MKKLRISIVSFSIFIISVYSYADEVKKNTAVFNQQWLKTLVSIEIAQANGKAKPIGTGFLVSTPNNHNALITARHVVYSDQGKGPLIQKLS